MGAILGLETGMDLPSIITGGTAGSALTIILTIVLFVIAGCVIMYIFLMNKKFNKKIIKFENISGQGYQVVGKDRARFIKIGSGGEEILFFRKEKTYRTAYGKKMGKNTYWFAKGQDGYWYNVLLGDLDAKKGMLDIEPVDRDMRYMHVAIRKNITERYRKIGFMEKFGSILVNGVFLIIMLIGLWLMLDQIGELVQQLISTSAANEKTLELITNALGKVDTMNSGGTGIVQS